MSELWINIDRIRREKGLKLKDLGLIYGITPQGVQTWKKRGRVPVEHLRTLAAYFRVSIDTLVDGGRDGDDKPGANLGAVVPRHAAGGVAEGAETPYRARPPPEAPDWLRHVCRFPELDIGREVGEIRDRLGTMETQLDTLLKLLGARFGLRNRAPEASASAAEGRKDLAG